VPVDRPVIPSQAEIRIYFLQEIGIIPVPIEIEMDPVEQIGRTKEGDGIGIFPVPGVAGFEDMRLAGKALQEIIGVLVIESSVRPAIAGVYKKKVWSGSPEKEEDQEDQPLHRLKV
jgi:hypothetical protein